ncbi:hypothetical protein [Tabrizicola sp.]|uniref:hypothetical protein n=1 Tax=Tabrizicola sp. TaxID=2005166 RepID=UPI002734919A|nr:hypothetical protein [Tabrizicola sp.]MDP3647384.1 hypothetical protein [Paracoccaceae bacterium]
MRLTVEEDLPLEQVEVHTTPLSLIRNRIGAILAFGVFGAAIGFGTGVSNPDTYTSTASLLVSPYSLSVLNYEPASLDLSGDNVVLDTQVQLLRSAQTLDRVAKVLLADPAKAGPVAKLPTSEAQLRQVIASNLSVRRVNSADIIEVSFSAEDPDFAAFVANEVVAQFLQGQRDVKAADLQKVGDEVERRVAILAQSAQAADLKVAEARGAQASVTADEKQALDQAVASLEKGIALIDELVADSTLAAAEAPLDDTRTALASALSDLTALTGPGELAGEQTGEQTGELAQPSNLPTLVREAEVTAKVHREMLQRLFEIRELSNFVSDDARLVAPAVAPATPSSIPPAVIAAIGFLSFFLFALLVAATVKTGARPEKEWA